MKYLLASYLLAKKQQFMAEKRMLNAESKRSKEYQEARAQQELAASMARQFKYELIEPMKLDMEKSNRLMEIVENMDGENYDYALRVAEEILAN